MPLETLTTHRGRALAPAAGTKAWVTRDDAEDIGLVDLPQVVRRSSRPSGGFEPRIPALLTRTSRPPAAAIVSAAPATEASSVTSIWTKRPPSSSAAASPRSRVARPDPDVVARARSAARRGLPPRPVAPVTDPPRRRSRIADVVVSLLCSLMTPSCAPAAPTRGRPGPWDSPVPALASAARRLPRHTWGRAKRRARPMRSGPGATGSTPAAAGLSAGARRRAPGLRREELASLAGVSVDYLSRLEQGRATNPSPQVLAALARALRLTDEERAPPLPRRRPGAARRGHDRPPHHPRRPADARPARGDAGARLRRGLGPGRLEPRSAPRCSATSRALSGRERNLAWREFIGDRPRPHRPRRRGDGRFRQELVSDLHAALGAYPEDERLAELIAELRAEQRGLRALLGASARSPSDRLRRKTIDASRGRPDHGRLRHPQGAGSRTCG